MYWNIAKHRDKLWAELFIYLNGYIRKVRSSSKSKSKYSKYVSEYSFIHTCAVLWYNINVKKNIYLMSIQYLIWKAFYDTFYALQNNK